MHAAPPLPTTTETRPSFFVLTSNIHSNIEPLYLTLILSPSLEGHQKQNRPGTTASMSTPHPDELQPEQTEGFKVGEKKTLEEYQQLGKSCRGQTAIALQTPIRL